MADAQIAYKIFRDKLLKAPSRSFGGVTVGAKDIPTTPHRTEANTSTMIPAKLFTYAGKSVPLSERKKTPHLNLPFQTVDFVFDASSGNLARLLDLNIGVVGLGGTGSEFLLSAPSLLELVLIPEAHRTGTLPAPVTPQRSSSSFTAVNDYTVADQPAFGRVWELMTSSKLAYKEELARRIFQIQQRLDEDESEKINLSGNSVAYLVEFLEANHVKRPQLAATPSGYLIARWQIQGRTVTIHFYRDGRAEYYVSEPNPLHPNKQDLDSSITTADALGTKLGRLGALTWIKW